MEKKAKKSVLGIVVVCIMAVFMIVVSTVLLFVPQIKTIHICYILCSAIIALGIYMIVHYFMTSAYRNMNEYSFSGGIFLVVLGVCGMVRAENLVEAFYICIGLLLLLSCVIKLQYTLDLKQMNDKIWTVVLGIMLVLTVCSVVVILNPFSNRTTYETYACYLLLIDGVATLIILIYVAIRLNILKKREIIHEEGKRINEIEEQEEKISKKAAFEEENLEETVNEKETNMKESDDSNTDIVNDTDMKQED